MKLLIFVSLITFIVAGGLAMFLTGTFKAPPPSDESDGANLIAAAGPEAKAIIGKLQKELADYENQIAAAAAELANYAEKITAAKAELAAMKRESEAELTNIKKEIELLSAEKAHISRTQQLAKLYSSMKPDSAADILCKLEDDLSMRILSQMNNRSSGQLMEAIAKADPDYAARISVLIADSKLPSGSQDRLGEVVDNN
jgi:flagellar motility protein MotE (MotC chaperone)